MKTIIVAILFMVLSACNDNTAHDIGKTGTAQDDKKGPCEVVDEKYIKAQFADAKDIFSSLTDGPYPLCSVRFIAAKKRYSLSLTFGPMGFASEQSLERAVSPFKGKNQLEDIKDVGDKAYNKTGGFSQISAIKNGNMLHGSFVVDGKYDLSKTKKFISDMFVAIEN